MSKALTVAALVAVAALPCVLLAQPAAIAHDSLTLGGRTIAADSTVSGPVVVAGGDLRVEGTINGSAVVVAGDLIVGAKGRITGDAVAAFGDVLNSGAIGGTARALTGRFGASMRSLLRGDDARAVAEQRSPIRFALGWFTVMMLIGFGVLIFASPYLDGVVDVLGHSFGRSLMAGLAGMIGALPLLLLACVALAITVIGVLLIPFAVVAIVLAAAGLMTLGFIAAARLTGDAFGGSNLSQLGARGRALRGVVVGLSLYMGLWLLAAWAKDITVVGIALRLASALVTFVAVAAGFGAALISRAGTRRDFAVRQTAPAVSDVGWQTPTPVAGVAAARRRAREQVETGAS